MTWGNRWKLGFVSCSKTFKYENHYENQQCCQGLHHKMRLLVWPFLNLISQFYMYFSQDMDLGSTICFIVIFHVWFLCAFDFFSTFFTRNKIFVIFMCGFRALLLSYQRFSQETKQCHIHNLFFLPSSILLHGIPGHQPVLFSVCSWWFCCP